MNAHPSRSIRAPRPLLVLWSSRRHLGVLLVAAGLSLQSAADSISPEFFAALRSGDSQEIGRALDNGASVASRDAKGNTPLMLAALYGDADSLKLLIRRGADVDATNIAGATALMRGSYDFAKLRLLLDHDADPNIQSASGNTALLLAARPANSHRAVKLLLDHGANAQATNRWGATALMAAVAGGDEKSVEILMERGANSAAHPTFNDDGFLFGGGRSALMWAAFRGNTEILNHLIREGADVNSEGVLGSPLSQAAWADRANAAKLLLDHGAAVNHAGRREGYTALHWAASSDSTESSLVQLLLKHGANPNAEGGENIDAFMGTPQTPLMLARRRGITPIVAVLSAAGATNETPDRMPTMTTDSKALAGVSGLDAYRSAVSRALPPLQRTSVQSKEGYLRHASHQDCTSCHQQFLPMAAIGLARKFSAPVDPTAERQLIEMVSHGEIKDPEIDLQPLFHPDPAYTKGYELFAWASQDLPANEIVDGWVHHLAAIQGPDGQWYNNLPRPPIQSDDIGATALAIQGLKRYPLPGRKAEFDSRIDRAGAWLRRAEARNTETRGYQILGLRWAGESPAKLQSLANALLRLQREDGGWSQLPGTSSDAYATGLAVYALRVGAGIPPSDPAIDRGLRFLLKSQLPDGTWYVRRRAFPFQPTMNSGFPHGRDSWVSAAGSSWAVMALSLADNSTVTARQN